MNTIRQCLGIEAIEAEFTRRGISVADVISSRIKIELSKMLQEKVRIEVLELIKEFLEANIISMSSLETFLKAYQQEKKHCEKLVCPTGHDRRRGRPPKRH